MLTEFKILSTELKILSSVTTYILFMHVYYMNVYMYELQFTYFYRFFVHCKTVFGIYMVL